MAQSVDDIKRERERFVAFAFAAAEIFFEIDDNGAISFEGGAVDRLAASAGKSLIGTSVFDLVHQDDRETMKALLTHLDHKGRIGPMPFRLETSDNKSINARIFALKMPSADSSIYIAMRTAPISMTEIDPGQISEDTGLLTKTAFLDIAARTMASSGENSNIFMTVASVDGLDEAETRFGKRHAQVLLNRIAAHLKTVSADGSSAGQIDDKTFAFLHRSKNDSKIIDETIENVGGDVKLTTTYSTMASEKSGMEEEQILRTLNYILTKFCENPGKINFESLANAYESLAGDAQRRVSDMHNMIETGNFNMAYQPIRSLTDNSLHHHEVLSRFQDSFEDETPLDVIRFAEDVGIIDDFDVALCYKAIDYVRKMRNLGTSITLAVNLSGRTLNSGRVVGNLMNQFEKAKSIAHNIIIEITETSAITNFQQVQKTLNDFKAMGYRLCLDDFGAGASGYQYLRAFNVDFVKIDGAYTKDINKPDYEPTFLLSMVKLCHDLGIKTIGEHVESKFEADFLRSLGVDYGQGYYFGKPSQMPVEQ